MSPSSRPGDEYIALSPGRLFGIVVACVALSVVAALLVGGRTTRTEVVSAPADGGEPVAAATSEPAAPEEPRTADRVAADPTQVGTPVGDRGPQTVDLSLRTSEVERQLADGTTYRYWTFNDQVPGPLLRVRVGDTVNLTLANAADSANVHSVDLHAVTGPGGGAKFLQVAPGESKSITFLAKNPGVYIYHCATPHVPTHIAQGMYGLIVVEPEGGLAPVDREFYVVQGELYTTTAYGAPGQAKFDFAALDLEEPTYVVFNGQAAALTGDHALQAEVGERVRMFVGNAGPNLISSFHVIGEIFDIVHPEGATETWSNVQTTLVPAGGATWVEFTLDVPGDYILVDHAIARVFDKGAVGILTVTGPEDPSVYQTHE